MDPTTCCSRYTSHNAYQASPDIWVVHNDRMGIIGNCLLSLSGYALCVIGNIHNGVMASSTSSKCTKIGYICLLELATLAIIIPAAFEGVVRLIIGATIAPFALLACLFNQDTGAVLFMPFLSGCITLQQIEQALFLTLALTTSTHNINLTVYE